MPAESNVQTVCLFSFGSNHTTQLAARVGREGGFQLWPGYLEHHARVFCGYSERWKGSVASCVPCRNARVFGSIVEITEQELGILDTYEGGYTRATMDIQRQDAQGNLNLSVLCYVYLSNDPEFQGLPSVDYLKAINKNLSEPNRPHRSTIMLRGVAGDTMPNDSGNIIVFGSWGPDQGFSLEQEYLDWEFQHKQPLDTVVMQQP